MISRSRLLAALRHLLHAVNDSALGLPVIQALCSGDEGRRMVAMLYLLKAYGPRAARPIGSLMGLYEPDEGGRGGGGPRPAPKRVATAPLVACTALGALYGLALGPTPAGLRRLPRHPGRRVHADALFFTGLSWSAG